MRSGWPDSRMTKCPSPASQIRTSPAAFEEATVRPSGENATELEAPVDGFGIDAPTGAPVRGFQSRTVSALVSVANRSPRGDQATETARPAGDRGGRTGGGRDHRRRFPSF